MRISSLQINQIGVFKNLSLDFHPSPSKQQAEIHIFTGTNGSGKSTLLKVLAAAFETAGVTPNGDIVCRNETNNLYKYLRNKNGKSGANIGLDISKEKKNDYEINFINYTGCPHGDSHLHIIKDIPDLAAYRIELSKSTKPDKEFYFAFFAYSGNRAFDYKENVNNSPNHSRLTYNRNPLHNSLEFSKPFNPEFRIEDWIRDSILKKGYASNEKLAQKENNYKNTITRLENAISEIVGFKVKFALDETLNDAVIDYNGVKHGLEILPDGLKSILAWLVDLCMRLDRLKWEGDIPLFDRNIILFLDEIEVHLHIEWQRKILPAIQKLFPNAQIFLSTHSPFVVNSVDNAWVYKLELKDGEVSVAEPTLSEDGYSVSYVMRDIFGVNQSFGLAVEEDLKRFYTYRDSIKQGKITEEKEIKKVKKLALSLAEQGLELETIVAFEWRQMRKFYPQLPAL